MERDSSPRRPSPPQPEAEDPLPVTDWTKFQLKARWIKFEVPDKEATTLSKVPVHGLGTLDPPEEDSQSGYAAIVLFILGFYWGFPWLLALFYFRADNYAARSAAVLSIVAIVVYCLVWLAWALTTGDWRFFFLS